MSETIAKTMAEYSEQPLDTSMQGLMEYASTLGIDVEIAEAKKRFTQRIANLERDQDALDACNRAAGILKRLGFALVHASRRSEACYYGLPGHSGVIRVAAHRFGRSEFNDKPVLAKITFGTNQGPVPNCHVEERVVSAVGRYFMARLMEEQDTKSA